MKIEQIQTIPFKVASSGVFLISAIDQGGEHFLAHFLATVKLDSERLLLYPSERHEVLIASPDRRNGKPVRYWRNDDGTWENDEAELVYIHPRI